MSASSSSVTEPSERTATEQYHPVRLTPTATAAVTGAEERHMQYHARATSFASDVLDDEDTLTMPVPKKPPHAEHGVLSPSRPSSRGSQAAAASSALSHSSTTPQHQQPRATGIVDSSGFHYTTRTAPAPPAQFIAETQHRQQRRSSPSSTAAASTSSPAATTTLLLPAPYNTPPGSTAGDAAAAAAAGPVRSTAQWQLSSPAAHSGRQHGADSVSATSGRTTAVQSAAAAAPVRGAVFEYASEAVNTLEQQYGDALQRLGTMHRLYDRLDAHNRTLEAEVQRVRHISDVLHNGVAFQVYNSVRQVKHEMRLLKQYVELLCAGFQNQLQALQQVVAEEVPRLLGRRDPYTSLLPYGAEGRLRAADTRVSVVAHHSRGGEGWGRMTPGTGPAVSRGASPSTDAAEASVCRPDHWWNSVSPHPTRGPPACAAADDAEAALDDGGAAAPLLQLEDGAGARDLAADEPPACRHATPPQLDDALVSRQAYRAVQAALAAAQRRVVELERDAAMQEATCEGRIAQLKAAHRAKQATLQEELTLLRRRTEAAAELTQQPQHQQLLALATAAGTAASDSGFGGEGSRGAVVPVDVKQLAQLLLELHGGGSAASGVDAARLDRQGGARRAHDAHASDEEEFAADDKGEVSIKRSSRREAPAPSRRTGKAAAAAPAAVSTLLVSSPSASISDTLDATDEDEMYADMDHDDDDDTDDDTEATDGPLDVRRSFDRTNRRVVQAVLERGGVSGTRGGALHRPDPYSPSAAARRAARAREVLGREATPSTRQPRAQSRGRTSSRVEMGEEGGGRVAATSGGPPSRSLAYERLVERKHAASASVRQSRSPGRTSAEVMREGGYAARTGSSAARPRPRLEDAPPSRSGARGGGGGAGVDPALLQTLLSQLAAMSAGDRSGTNSVTAGATAAASEGGGGSRRLRAAPRPRDADVDRVAQGLWAQELLKERNYL